LKPIRRSAFRTSASRRHTGVALRAGPYSGGRLTPITRPSTVASSVRLVSVPLAMLSTSSVIVEVAARRFASAMSVTYTKSIV